MEDDLKPVEIETIAEVEEATEDPKSTEEDDYIIDIPVDEDMAGESNKENDDLSEALDDLLTEIFKDIIKSNKQMGVINSSNIEKTDETIELNNEFYCNKEDLIKATKNYYKKNKGNKFKVKGIEEDLSITRKGLRRLKKAMKKCSTLILLKDKKLSSTDIKRVYGKDTADKYDDEVKKFGTIKTEYKEGYYTSAEEYKDNLKHLFGVKRDSWLQRLKSKLKSKLAKSEEQEEVEYIEEYEEENVKTR